MTSSRLSSSLSHAWIFWDRHRLVRHFEGYTWSSWHSYQGDSGKEWRFVWKEISLFRPPLHRRWASRPPSLLLHRPAAPRLAVLGRPSAPWPGVPTPRIPLSARPDLMQGPGVLLPPRVPAPAKCSEVRRPPPGSRASRASVGLGGSPADAHCGKRLRHPAPRRWSWTTPLGGRPGQCPRWH